MNLPSPEVLSSQLLWHCARISYFADLTIPIVVPTPTKLLEIPEETRIQEVYRIRGVLMDDIFSLRNNGFSAIALEVSLASGIYVFLAPTPEIGKPSTFVFHPFVIERGVIKLGLDLYKNPDKFHTFSITEIRQIYLFPSLALSY